MPTFLRLFCDFLLCFSDGTPALLAFWIEKPADFEHCWAKTFTSTHPPPRAIVHNVFDVYVCFPCDTMQTIATAAVTLKTTSPTAHLAAIQIPRPSLLLSPACLVPFRILCLSTSSLSSLRDSTGNRKSSLRKVNAVFSRSIVALVRFCTTTPLLSRCRSWSFSRPFVLGTSPSAEIGCRPDKTGLSASPVFLRYQLLLFRP